MKSDNKIDSRIEIKVEYVEDINAELNQLTQDFPSTLAISHEQLEVDGSGHNVQDIREQLEEIYSKSKNECFNRSVIDILQLISELEELEKYREMDSQYRPR